MSLNEVQQDFGKAATLSQKEPVLVESEKVPVAVILSVSEFERLREVQFDEFFGSVTQLARKLPSGA